MLQGLGGTSRSFLASPVGPHHSSLKCETAWESVRVGQNRMQNSHVFGLFFAIRNDYHIIVNECRSSMVCMHPWFTCSLGLHALCSLLCWVQYVNTQGKYKMSSKLHAELQIAWDYYPRIPHFQDRGVPTLRKIFQKIPFFVLGVAPYG